MARGRRNRVDWRTVTRRIRSGKLTPIISDRVFFPGRNMLLEQWAKELRYPFPEERGLTIPKMAQYLAATSRDDLTAKEDFLEFSKEYLLESVRETADDNQLNLLDRLEDELPDLTFSELAARLDFPKYDDEFENPLFVLASLPLPIYITTSYYDFMERALVDVGKRPRTEVCYWQDELIADIPSIFEDDPDYEPSEEEPLVFHLNGRDDHPASLVLTEDDYLDFLIRISQDMNALPRRVAQALVDSSLIMLGYQLEDWNFKTMFRGLIKSKRASRRRLSLALQYTADAAEDENLDPRDVEEYLQRYFDKANFDIYWGEPTAFVQELWEEWDS